MRPGKAHARGPVKNGLFRGFFSRRAMTRFSARSGRFTRASKKRSRLWTMTPRCFLAMAGTGPRRVGGEIFSNEKAGIVYPLAVELKLVWNSLRYRQKNCLWQQTVPSRLMQVDYSSIIYAKMPQFASHCGVPLAILRWSGDVRSPFPDIRRARRRRCADRATIGFSRGVGAPEADRVRNSPRGSATK